MTASPDNPLAPGCFGSALGFNADARECASCAFVAECGPVAHRRRATLQQSLGFEIRLSPPKNPKPVVANENGGTMVAELPKKVRELMQRIENAGIKVVSSFAQNENPFPRIEGKKPHFLRIACHLLLRLENGVNRELLKTQLMKRLDWAEATAAAHVTQAVQTLVAYGVAVEINGRLTRKRNT